MRRFKEAIKQDVIGFILLCFLVGAGFIWLGDAYGILKLTDADKISDTVLWLTALAIFWYAYEAYQLKLSTAQQVELQEVIMQNEFLPILEPVAAKTGDAVLRGGNFTNLQIRNLGKGPAKYIEIYIGGTEVAMNWSLASSEAEAVKVDRESKPAVKELLAKAPTTVRVRILYQDIYKRKFQTEHIVFDRTARGRYTLVQGSWDFKRVRT